MAVFPNGVPSSKTGGLIQWVSPLGSDNNNGRSEFSPMKTGYAAYSHIVDAGGGELHFMDASEWGGPVASQGIWLRGDRTDIPGWQQVVPCDFYGHGGQKVQFGRAAARLIGGSPTGGDRFHPLIWLVSSGFSPVSFNNILPAGSSLNCNQIGRFGWDYRRNTDGSIALANITNWNRSAGSAVLTVSLPAGTTITSASRTSNVTTLNFAAQVPLNAFPGMWIHVTSTDVNFASGDYQVTDYDTHGTFLKYAETAADATGTTIGTWATHGVMQYDRIEVVSTSSEVPTTMYRVTATTASTITVVDPYGTSPRSATVSVNNPGQYVLQDRANYLAGLFDLFNVGGTVSPNVSVDAFTPGPNLDFGGTTDGRIDVGYCSNSGYALTGGLPADPDRACWMLGDGGSHGSAGLYVHDCRNGQTGIRFYGSKVASWGIDCRRVNSDSNFFSFTSPPALEVIEGGTGATIVADSTVVWDNPDSAPNVKSDAPEASHSIVSCGTVELNGVVFSNNWASKAKSPIVSGQTGFWLDRVNADIPQARRAFSPALARYQNWLQDDVSTWNLGGGEVTSSTQPGPNGLSGSAIRLTRVSGTDGVYVLPQDINNNPHTGSPVVHAVGDRWVMGGWFRNSNGLASVGLLFSFSFAGANGNFSIFSSAKFDGDGEWQWVTSSGTLTTISNSASGWRAIIGANPGSVGKYVDTFRVFLTRIPAGDMTDNEFAEYVLSLQSNPYYLTPGNIGTARGEVLVGDGGLSTGDSGNGTGVVRMFNGSSAAVSPSGTAELRYNSGTNKIQYSKNGGAWTDLV